MHCFLKSQLWRWLWISRIHDTKHNWCALNTHYSEAINALKLLFVHANCELVSIDVLLENWPFFSMKSYICVLLLKRRQHEGFQLEGETFLWKMSTVNLLIAGFSICFSFQSPLYLGCMLVWQYCQSRSEFLLAF